jgi:hypothetical protein
MKLLLTLLTTAAIATEQPYIQSKCDYNETEQAVYNLCLDDGDTREYKVCREIVDSIQDATRTHGQCERTRYEN